MEQAMAALREENERLRADNSVLRGQQSKNRLGKCTYRPTPPAPPPALRSLCLLRNLVTSSTLCALRQGRGTCRVLCPLQDGPDAQR